ncbi:hypothetical protein [Nonomuraea sp. NPDC049709]|uniref:hypothetical protein n=1 Tax=Nonomuraea sp. NPDC049709 TaxID=3154736 RepID=UPI0034332230
MRGYIKALLITAMSASSAVTGGTAAVTAPDPPPPILLIAPYDKDWPTTSGYYKSANRRA